MSALEIAALIVPWVLVAGLAFALYQLFGQYGRALLNVDELRMRMTSVEQSLAAHSSGPPTAVPLAAAESVPPLGLPAGSQAPDWELRDLDGELRTLDDYLGERPLLIVFFSTTCGFCTQMAPRLGELTAEGPRVLLVSSGSADDLRAMAAEHNWSCDVVLEDGQVMMAYGGRGTPTGYLIGGDGTILTELAMGSDALFTLYGAVAAPSSNGHGDLAATLREKTQAATERARAAGLAVKDVGESRIKRDGLGAGTPAPDFTLPDLKGSVRSLKRFRGKRVLLVFSDVGCGPCQTLAPDLERLHEEHKDDLEVVMVSRGDADENRKKVAEQGLTFPVLLQKSWEVSKEYAMFATPVAYLIDENGVIEKNVAVGANSILELV